MGDIESLLIMIIVSMIIPFGSASQWDKITVPISKEGCESMCGNVSIPFPFGMGHSSCFLDKEFEVTCNKSVTPPRLLLKLTHLEVIKISMSQSGRYSGEFYDNEVVIKGPISFLNCPDHNNTNPQGLKISGTPFSFSEYNMFVASSCGVRATLESSSDNIFTQIGCTSVCSPRSDRNTSDSNTIFRCDGTDCCHTSIPSILDSFSIKFEGVDVHSNDGDNCRFALVSSSDYWYDYMNHSKSFAGIRAQDYVPLILDWKLDNHSHYHIFKENIDRKHKEINRPYCSDRSSRDSMGSYITCYCDGMLGNPYLVNGCTQDIDECNRYHDFCGYGSTCVNTNGGYYCSNKKKFIIIGFGSSLGALFLLFALWGSYRGIKKRKETKRKRMFFKQNGGLILQQQLSSNEGNIEKTKLFNSDELEKATDRFSTDRILGKGGQGTVYKGMLEDGKIVAVKKSITVDESKLSEFINEVVILSQINHRNVVQLLGCCLETEVPILVYEFIPNGTLSEYIHEQNEEFPFTWKTRIRIASEIAGALSYLHSAAAFPIYHRDIKSTNILLDEKYKAKVADFGTSRTISLEQTHLTTLVYGTFGYLDPEYFQSCQFTEKSDVYSFGVVLAELLTGQKAICSIRAEEGRNLATFFIMSMEANALFDILDPQVLEDGPKEEIEAMASLALACLSLSGRNRPTMKEVAMDLEGIHNKEKRSEAHSHSPNNQINNEVEYVGTDLIQSWDVTSASTESAVDRSLLLQELPLLSIESR